MCSPVLKDEGFFAGAALTFKINTGAPFNWEVRRKDKEFNLLREYLVKMYPHILIPALLQHKQKKKFEPKFLKKRQRFCEVR